MASRIHRDKKADEKLVNDGKLTQSERNEAMIKALHDQIESLREQVNQGLAREEDWKKREQKWEKREESWNNEREALLILIQQERDKLTEARSEGSIKAKREKKAAGKAEVILQKAEATASEDIEIKLDSR